MRLSLIVAVSENGIIGDQGRLPWRLSADLRRFKRITMGHTLIMGRKTHASIGRKLPGRTSIVISRNPRYLAHECQLVGSWDEALVVASTAAESFVIGGDQIYRLALPHVERLYWTQVHASVAGDVSFPTIDWRNWIEVGSERVEADADNEYASTFRVLDRSQPDAVPRRG